MIETLETIRIWGMGGACLAFTIYLVGCIHESFVCPLEGGKTPRWMMRVFYAGFTATVTAIVAALIQIFITH